MVKTSDVLSVSDIMKDRSAYQTGKTYHFVDVLDPGLIKSYNYRPTDDANVKSKLQSINLFGIVTPLVLVCDLSGTVFIVDGNNRIAAAILHRSSAIVRNSTHLIPASITFIDIPITQWDSVRQTQFNYVSENIIDRALRYNELRKRKNLDNFQISELDNCHEKRVERTMAVLFFTPKILEFIRAHARNLPENFVCSTARQFKQEKKVRGEDLETLQSEYLLKLKNELEGRLSQKDGQSNNLKPKVLKKTDISSEIAPNTNNLQSQIECPTAQSKLNRSWLANFSERMLAFGAPKDFVDEVMDVMTSVIDRGVNK